MIVDVLKLMRDCFERYTALSLRRLPLYLEELMVYIDEAVNPNELVSSRMGQLVMELASEISRTPATVLDVDKEAKKREVSADYLRHCFKQINGISLHEFQLSQRYALAVRLLRETELPVGEIGERCGFSAQRLFTHFFKKRSGFPPRDFRKHTY